ncbi:MAG TPA: diguanylate cyclase [Trebonia sp.]
MRDAVRAWRQRPTLRVPGDTADTRAMTIRYLMYVLLPAWFIPGVADWVMHRRTGIEQAGGLRESLVHALMMGEIAVPVTLVLLCEVNPPLLALCLAAGLGHEATAIWDVRMATDAGREVRPAEQHIHSFLESLPFMALSALLCLHWDEVADPATWRAPIRLRARRLPGRYLAGVFAGVCGLIAVPYAEEAWRCARARPARH